MTSAKTPATLNYSDAILPPDVTLYEFAKNETLFSGLNPESESWWAWDCVFKLLSHMELEPKERDFILKVTGGVEYEPDEQLPGIIVIILGRKGAKSTKGSQIALHRTLQFQQDVVDPPLGPGEWARNLIVAPASRASRVTIDYCDGQLNALVENTEIEHPVISRNFTEQKNELVLTNGCILATQPVNKVTGRSPSLYTLILEEAGFFGKDGYFSDIQVFKSLRPGMSRFGKKALCVILTSPPEEQQGLVWMFYRRFFGKKNRLALVINAETVAFNPKIDEEFLEEEQELFAGEDMEGDPEYDENYYKREYLGQFTDAPNQPFSTDAVALCIDNKRLELPFMPQQDYFAFVDPSTLTQGSSELNDEYAIGIGHIEEKNGRQKQIVDVIRAWSPDPTAKNYASPREALDEAVELLEEYEIEELTGDQWSGKDASGQFEERGFVFDFCETNKSDLYCEFLSTINRGDVELPNEPKANQQLTGLRAKRTVSKLKIDHGKRKKDDRANVYAGLSYRARLHTLARTNTKFPNADKIATAKWQTEKQDKHVYCAGLFWPKDTGFMVLSVIDSCCKEFCFQLRVKRTAYETHLDRVEKVVKDFNLRLIHAEPERIGESLFEQLRKDKIPLRQLKSQGKNFATEALITAAEKGHIKTIPDRYLLREMRVFICETLQSGFVRYRAVGYQGGCVFALALAWQGVGRVVSLSDVKVGGGRGGSVGYDKIGPAVEEFAKML